MNGAERQKYKMIRFSKIFLAKLHFRVRVKSSLYNQLCFLVTYILFLQHFLCGSVFLRSESKKHIVTYIISDI